MNKKLFRSEDEKIVFRSLGIGQIFQLREKCGVGEEIITIRGIPTIVKKRERLGGVVAWVKKQVRVLSARVHLQTNCPNLQEKGDTMGTSNNIMKLKEFKNSVFYRAACGCSDPTCNQEIEMEYDKELNMVTLGFYMDMYLTDYWGKNRNFFEKLWFRIKYSAKLLFTGEIHLEQYFLIK